MPKTKLLKLRGFLDENIRCGEMSKDLTELFMKLSMMEARKSAPSEEDLQGDGLYQILKRRLDFYNVECDGLYVPMLVRIIIGEQPNPNPAMCVLWAYTLFCINKDLGRKIDIMDFSTKFRRGFPEPEEFEKAWDNQKGHIHGLECDNILDAYGWDVLYEGLDLDVPEDGADTPQYEKEDS